VLEVDCGFGDSTVRIARSVGPEGHAVGVDGARNFVDAATRDAEQAGARNAAFFVTDVQRDDLRGPYDSAFPRFGTMFFSLPRAAMLNIRRALGPGGELTMIVRRRREDNPWLHDGERCVKAIVPAVSHEDTGQVRRAPGPLRMSGPDTVSELLRAAGHDRITFERVDSDICIGRDLVEAIAFAMAFGPAAEVMRLAGDEGARRKDPVADALRDTLGKYRHQDGVWAPSSTWFVSARNP
jgi:SAM-dependent methyltransferase